jgi:hypothetical protein
VAEADMLQSLKDEIELVLAERQRGESPATDDRYRPGRPSLNLTAV